MNNSNKKIKILVTDDHQVLRHGLIDILKYVDKFEIVGQASNGKETLAVLEEYAVDIILLDIEMPVMNGTETLEHVKNKYPETKVIMFSTHHSMGYENYFLKSGAEAYLVKNVEFELICNTILNVYTKGSKAINNDTVNGEISDEHLQQSLSGIEQDVLKLICKNHKGDEICKSLDISKNTLKYYRKSIYSKTRTSSLSELIIYAIKQGLISIN